MSDEKDKSSKTEKPTPHKLREARKKGQVARSKDLASTVNICCMFLYIWLIWDYCQALLSEFFINVFSHMESELFMALDILLHQAIIVSSIIILPAILIGLFSTILGNMIQFGFIFSTHPITPNIKNIDPIKGFKRIFAVKNIVETLKSIVKTLLLVASLSYIVYSFLPELLRIVYCDVSCAQHVANQLIMLIAAVAVLIFVCLSIFDFVFQKSQFIKDQMMTKEELKRDNKNTDGDPLIKQKRREIQQEVSAEDLNRTVSEATVLVFHGEKAVTLHYEEETTPLPIVTLIEQKQVADRLKSLAKKHDKPIMEDASVIKHLWDKNLLNQYIPSESIDDVAAMFSIL